MLFCRKRLRFCAVFFLLPLFLPSSSIAVLWRVLFGSGSALVKLLKPMDAQWKYVTLTVLCVWKNMGAVTALALIGMLEIPHSVFDAAEIDGANKRVMFFRIELPLLRHITMFSVLYLFMNGLRVFRETYLLYGSYPPANLYFVQHYITSHFESLDLSLLSGASVIFSLSSMRLFGLAWLILKRGRSDEA